MLPKSNNPPKETHAQSDKVIQLPTSRTEDSYSRSTIPRHALFNMLLNLIERLSHAEKAQVLQWIVRDLGDAVPGIESIPGVSGGEPCIVRTRIPVWLLVQSRRLGMSEADILQNYPSLRAEDLTNAWAYARSHRDEIEQQILENEMA